MKSVYFIILIIFIASFFSSAELINDSLYISPLYTDPVQSTTVFSNPAELAHWNNLAGLELRYRTPESGFSGTLTLATPDFLLGNLALSIEAFGTDFGSNLIWLPETTDREAQFSLTKGGQKFVLTWAKRLEQATFGADIKYYRYRELDTGKEETGFGFDAGFLYHPWDRLYLGIVVNDLTDTEIFDASRAIVSEIPERIRLTAALSPLDDLSFTVGAPVDIFSDRLDSREIWRKMSFSARKIWDKGLNAEVGYNSRDAYAALGYILSDAINLKVIISNDLSIQDGQYQALFFASAVLPTRVWTKISSGLRRTTKKIIISNKTGINPLDFLFNMWLGVNDNLMTRSIYLDFTNPKKTREKVRDLLSPDGTIEIDRKRGRLIITDFRDNVQEILEAIRRIEARAERKWQEHERLKRQDTLLPIPQSDFPKPQIRH